ncbi:MAG: FixH family protein [Ferruginibacter sp.]|nr:FixH family protein [Chitinophagaceae bacterium]MBP6285587.1 FixH family protein [Ferruginibacter sp.]MBU9935564.1 FixH family protein [Ferruginibacter sp.]
MNWGYKILFVYIAFVAGILAMVFGSSSQKVDLVTPDYYAKELKYQDKIDELGRVAALSAPVTYELTDDKLVISFPKDFTGKKLVGEAVLYCPSDENKDIKKNFSVQDEPLSIPLGQGKTGMYELQLSWKEGTVSYYFEKRIFI